MQILTESLTPSESGIITEFKKTGKDVFLEGIFMQAEIKNRNKRWYPYKEIKSAVDSLNEHIKSFNGVFGELDHPNSLIINMDRISHVIKEIKMVGNNAVGKAMLLEDTPMGKIAIALAKTGVRYGVSSRGGGNVKSDGIVEGYVITTVDLVATPSAAGAMPIPVYESLNSDLTGRRVMTLAESMRDDKSAQKFFTKAINDWIKTLKI